MKVILVFVSTLNGKITNGDDPEVRHWSSKSDQDYYRNVWQGSNLVVMGSRTYDLNIIRPKKGRLVVIMTSRPSDYKDQEVSSQLVFTDMKPRDLVAYYSEKKYELMTVVGGNHLATSFLKDSLVDELWLTIEPRLFGKGLNLLSDDDLIVSLKMLSMDKVNDNGTLITKYSIVRNSL
jgi:dihydrofolate reductase